MTKALISRKKKYSCVAWTGIAANLLPNGGTVHSTFKLPLNITAQTTCNVKINSKYADYLKSIDVILWDEISMTPKDAFECVNCLLRDICDTDEPFGGKIIVLCGDFRQI